MSSEFRFSFRGSLPYGKLYNMVIISLQYAYENFTMILATLYNDSMLGSLYQLPEDFYGQ